MSRRPRSSSSSGPQWVPADVTDRHGVRTALRGAGLVCYLVHSLGSPDFAARDALGAEILAEEAERAGARQIVYLGGLGDASPELSPHLRSRRETGERLAAGPVPVTTVRAAMVVGKGSAAFETTSRSWTACPGW